jgi:hypothetical protein
MQNPRFRVLWPIALAACTAYSPAAVFPGDDATVASDSTSGDDSPTEYDAARADAGGSLDTAPGADASSDATDGGATCPGLFCEDFEQGQLDRAKWDVLTADGGTESIQQQTVGHGRFAMQVHGTGSSSDFALILTKEAPPSLKGPGPVFGRAYLFVAASIQSLHTELAFAGTAGFPKLDYMELAEYGNGSWQLGFDLFNPDPSIASGFVEEATHAPGHDLMPIARWSCVEWEFDDRPDMMLLWVDGKEVDQFDADHIDYSSTPRTPGSILNGKSSDIIGGFAVFGFGFHAWHPSNPFDLFYDDIVLDRKRVGCLP